MRHLAPSALLLAALSGPAWTADLILPDLPPWAEETPNHEKKGLAVEIAAALHERSGLPLNMMLMPLPRQIASLRSERSGFALIGLYQDLPDQIVTLGKGFDLPVLAVASRDDPAPTRERLTQLHRVGIVRGGQHLLPPDLAKDIPFEEIRSTADGVKMLEARRIDALITSSFALAALGDSGLAERHLGTPQPLFTGRISLAASVAAASSADGKALAAAWDDICRDGTVARILQRGTFGN
jgi:ABC-type amino acid transport substrate-binding protein